MKSSADYNLVRAQLEENGIYVPEEKIGELGLFCLENVGYESVFERLKVFEAKYKKTQPYDDVRRFFVGNPKLVEFEGIKISSENLARDGLFGIYVLPCKEALLDMENPTRHYNW